MTTTSVDLDELQEALRATELFEMLSAADVRKVAAAGEVRQLKRGEFLFRKNDDADSLHLLLDGAIEIVRPTHESAEPVPVAYVSPGELIGDMAIFTGTQRRSDGRVPQRARVWSLSRAGFEELARELPGYGMELTRMFARRLQDLISHMRRQARRKELAGKLRYFDMPTVVQTLITAGQTGLLTFVDDDGHVYAEAMLRGGTVDRARCGQLEGEDAFHEIFLHKDDGEFYFRSLVDPDPRAVSKSAITTPAMHLMMEAMRRADELAELREKLGGTTREYRAAGDAADWPDAATAKIAAQILAELKKPRRLEDLRGTVPCSSFVLYRIASELVEQGLLA
jgi:CRP-like cAMP-binding protein